MEPATAASVPAKAYSSALIATTTSSVYRRRQHAIIHCTGDINHHRFLRTKGPVTLAVLLKPLTTRSGSTRAKSIPAEERPTNILCLVLIEFEESQCCIGNSNSVLTVQHQGTVSNQSMSNIKKHLCIQEGNYPSGNPLGRLFNKSIPSTNPRAA